MKIKKIYIAVLISIITIFSFNLEVNAGINTNAAGGEREKSRICSTSVCASTVGIAKDYPSQPIDGIKVILMDGNNSKKSAKLWFTKKKKEFAGGSKSIGTIFKKYKKYNGEIFDYNNMLQKIEEDQDVDTVKTLLKKIDDDYTLKNCSNYYIVVEPIFVVRYMYASSNYYYSGTVKEVFDGMVARPTSPPKHDIWAEYFAYNDDASKCDNRSVTVGRDTYSTSGGDCGIWNVLRNYTDTFKLDTTYGPFTDTTGRYVHEKVDNYSKNIWGKGIITISDYVDYNVTYDGNGGKYSGKTTLKDGPIKKGDNYTTKGNFFERDGYTFLGWNEKKDGTGTSWTDKIGNPFKWNYTKDITLYAQWEPNFGSLEIEKVNQKLDPIKEKDVTFNIYPTNNCSGTPISFSFNTGGNGKGTISTLSPKKYYSIKETQPPEGYGISNECISVGYLNPGATLKKQVINRTQCEIDVLSAIKDGTINTVAKRIEIYRNVGGENLKHRNLLNFEKVYVNGGDKDEFASDLCGQPDCSTNRLNTSCLSINGISNFSDTNWSCYKETISNNSKVGYCYTNFNFNKNSQIYSTVNQGYTILGQNIKAGQFIFKTPILGSSKVTETCYFIENQDNYIFKGKVGDYLETIKFNGEDITSNRTTSPTDLQNNFRLQKEEKTVLNSTIYKYKGEFNEDYRLKEVLVEKIKGENCNVRSNKCVGIGYGLISKFKDAKEVPTDKLVRIPGSSIDYIKVPFEVSFKSRSNLSTVTDETCVYSVQPEIIEYQENTNGKLELEFRSIDKNKPFDRPTNSNWCGEGSDPCNKNNTTVQEVIKERNDSYNRTGAGALYTNQPDGTRKIILTPDKIQQIKDYNRRVGSYNDYTNYTNIVEGEEITSTAFLDELEIRKVS